MACKIQKKLYQADEWLCFKGLSHILEKQTCTPWTPLLIGQQRKSRTCLLNTGYTYKFALVKLIRLVGYFVFSV